MSAEVTYTVPEKAEEFIATTFPAALKSALEKACLKVEADSKHNCPSMDGTLRASITH